MLDCGGGRRSTGRSRVDLPNLNSFTFHALLHRSFRITYERPNKYDYQIDTIGQNFLEIMIEEIDVSHITREYGCGQRYLRNGVDSDALDFLTY